jgi:hypothetical protein
VASTAARYRDLGRSSPLNCLRAAAVRRVLTARRDKADAVALVLEHPEVLPAAVLALVPGGRESRASWTTMSPFVTACSFENDAAEQSTAEGGGGVLPVTETVTALKVSRPEFGGPPSTTVISWATKEKPITPIAPIAARLPETARHVTSPSKTWKPTRSPNVKRTGRLW